MSKLSVSYKESLHERLADPAYAAGYLDAALEDGDPRVFRLALRDVAEEVRGIARAASDANLKREGTCRIISEQE